MLDQVRTAACSRNQHIRRQGRGSLLVYVRMNIHYDQSPREGALRDTISPFWLLGSSHTLEQSLLHKVFNIYYVRNAFG